MRAGHIWALGAVGLIVVGVALFVLGREIQARHEKLESARASVELGINLYQQGAFDDAQVEFGKALQGDPAEWRTPFYLGIMQIQLGQYSAAVPFLEQAFILNPMQPKIPNALGVTYFKLGKLDLAKGYFAVSLELDPTNADTKSMLETMTKLQRKAAQAKVTPEG